jgi:hypothetical protein
MQQAGARVSDEQHARRIDDHKRREQCLNMKRYKKHATPSRVAEASSKGLPSIRDQS